jgi:hypothetical protein
MICPVRFASDMSALRAVLVGGRGQHDLTHEGRDAAGDESTGSDFASHNQEDPMVAGGGDAAPSGSATRSLVVSTAPMGGSYALRPEAAFLSVVKDRNLSLR